MKMRPARLVPLTSQQMDQLKELQVDRQRKVFISIWVRSKDKPVSDMTINASLKYFGYSGEEICCGHGFRSMACILLN
jgi:integrase